MHPKNSVSSSRRIAARKSRADRVNCAQASDFKTLPKPASIAVTLLVVTEQAQALVSSALQRAERAANLLATLPGQPTQDVEAAWTAKIEQPAQRMLQEGNRGRSWDQIQEDL